MGSLPDSVNTICGLIALAQKLGLGADDDGLAVEFLQDCAVELLQPQWVIGIGGFAERCLRAVLAGDQVDAALARRVRIGQILHPSPASPAANRGWSDAVDRTFSALGLSP